MIAKFFHDLNARNVEFLLISGQATVLYGAAAFSEDIDLWIRPEERTRKAFLEVLEAAGATYHKLTPSFSLHHLAHGHGFHFVLDDIESVFLDVMGKPPRVSDYVEARQTARVISTGWGEIPTVGIRDLVEIKKTQRIGDYPVISRLAHRYLDSLAGPQVADYEWAVQNTFTLHELRSLIETYTEIGPVCRAIPALGEYVEQVSAGVAPDEEIELTVERWLTERVLKCQAEDRHYWRDIIDELKAMRKADELMPEGVPVSAADGVGKA